MALKQRLFSLTEPQERWLLTRAGELGISHAELMRRILDAARGEIGELNAASAPPPATLAPGNGNPRGAAPSERSAAILDLMRYCQEHKIPENRITQLLTDRMNGGDWRQAQAADYRAVLMVLQHSTDSTLYPGLTLLPASDPA